MQYRNLGRIERLVALIHIGDDQIVVWVNHRILIQWSVRIEVWFLILLHHVIEHIAVLEHIDWLQVGQSSYVLIRHTEGMLYTATIHRFTTYIVAECIVLAARCTITSKDHHIVLTIVAHVLSIHLASFYSSNRTGDCLALIKRKYVVELTTFIVLGLSMQEEHKLVLVVRIEELLCH